MRSSLAALSLCLRHCPSILGAPICAVMMAGLVPVIVANSTPWTMSAKSARLIVKYQDRVVSPAYPPNVLADARPVKTESFRQQKPSVVKVLKAKPRAKRQRHQRRNVHRSTRYARSN